MKIYSEKEKEEIVKAFKVFVKKVIKHSAVDYSRKLKARKSREIEYSDFVESKMSLSVYDSDIFSYEEDFGYENIENVVSKKSYKMAISLLNGREKKIIYLYSKGYSVEEIAKLMKTTTNSIYVTKNNIKRKIKNYMEEIEDGE